MERTCHLERSKFQKGSHRQILLQKSFEKKDVSEICQDRKIRKINPSQTDHHLSQTKYLLKTLIFPESEISQ